MPRQGASHRKESPLNAEGPSAQQLNVIEEFGHIFEAHGIPRMAGRILGRLMMCDPPHQSLAQLGEHLQASKGSVSTMTRLLIQRSMAERITFPGDRQDYVRVRSGSAGELFRDLARHAELQSRLLERALEVVDSTSEGGDARVREALDFFCFMREEVPTLLERWEARDSTRHSATAHPSEATASHHPLPTGANTDAPAPPISTEPKEDR